MKSLKDRLHTVESLLRTAGILHEEDLDHDLSDLDDEDPLEEDDQTDQRPQSSGQTSTISSASRADWNQIETVVRPTHDHVDTSVIFQPDGSDDSRYNYIG